MSDSPKYSQARLDQLRRERLERERKTKAEEEAKQRSTREEAERKRRAEEEKKRREKEAQLELQRQLERVRGDAEMRIKEIARMASEHSASMTGEDGSRVSAASTLLATRIASAVDAAQLKSLRLEIDALSSEIASAVDRKQKDDAERQRLREITELGEQLATLRENLALTEQGDRTKFDPNGASLTDNLVRDSGIARSGGDPAKLRPLIKQLESAVSTHLSAVEKHKTEWLARRQAAQAAVGELAALVEGLFSDPVVTRWCSPSLAKLSELVKTAELAAGQERFDEPATQLAVARTEAEALIKRANEAQLKAEQRDYIIGSLANVLSGMGFVVDPPQEEHPGHPASAHILAAHSASGKGFSVSVPVEGDIMYDADGFSMESHASESGAVRTCDEAEEVLEDMKHRLEEAFGIVTGELMWEGKPPERISKTANELPSGGPSRQAEGYPAAQ